MKRLFFALWPDNEVRGQCAQLIQTLAEQEGRPVEPGNLHVTLVFLGAVDASTELAITNAAAEMPKNPITLAFDRLDYWQKPRILCLRATHPEPASVTLAMKLKVAAAQFGIAADERPFTPHITLIRKARQPVQVDFKPIIWTTDSFCLAESRSSPEGVEYRVLRRW